MKLYITSFSMACLKECLFPYHTEQIEVGGCGEMFHASFQDQCWSVFFISGQQEDNHIALLIHCLMLLRHHGKKLQKKHRDVLLSGCDYLPAGSFIWNELDQYSDDRISQVAATIGLVDSGTRITFAPRYWTGSQR